jgi:nitrogen PTS system EIIA component
MDVTTILKLGSIRCESHVKSKKHALDLLSEILAEAADGPTAEEVMNGLIVRERLGSTGLGQAIAVPHAKLAGVTKNVGAVLKLDEPVEFGSPDGRPVDLLFGLLLPVDPNGAGKRQVDELVKKLRDPKLQRELRSSMDPQTLYSLMSES